MMFYFMIVLVSLLVFGFLITIALVSKGFNNKFGPEWIPGELGIRFYLMSPSIESRKTIKIFLRPTDADNVLLQINSHIRKDIANSKAGYEQTKLHVWSMADLNTFECKNTKTDKMKAIFKLEENMLIYFK